MVVCGTIQLVAVAEQLFLRSFRLTVDGPKAVKQSALRRFYRVSCVKLDPRVNPGVLVCSGGIVASFREACTCCWLVRAVSTFWPRHRSRERRRSLHRRMKPPGPNRLVFLRIPM